MNKAKFYLMGLILGALSLPLEAASTDSVPANTKNPVNSSATKESAAATEEKYNIMKRDEIDNTNVLAIPFDNSEIEDEEEIDHAEKNDTFPLPHSR